MKTRGTKQFLQNDDRMDGDKWRWRNRIILYLVILFAVLLIAFIISPLGKLTSPKIIIGNNADAIGVRKVVCVEVADKNSGLRSVDIVISQSGKRHSLLSRDYTDNKTFSANISLEVKPV